MYLFSIQDSHQLYTLIHCWIHAVYDLSLQLATLLVFLYFPFKFGSVPITWIVDLTCCKFVTYITQFLSVICPFLTFSANLLRNFYFPYLKSFLSLTFLLHVSHPYVVVGLIIVVHVLSFTFLDRGFDYITVGMFMDSNLKILRCSFWILNWSHINSPCLFNMMEQFWVFQADSLLF